MLIVPHRGVTSTSPSEHLGPILDILNGSELVLAVYRRVEGVLPEEIVSKKSNKVKIEYFFLFLTSFLFLCISL